MHAPTIIRNMPRPSHAHESSVHAAAGMPPAAAARAPGSQHASNVFPADGAGPAHPLHALIFDRAASRAVDRAAIDEFDMPGILLMENAARGLCECALRIISESCPSAVHPGGNPAPVPHALVICGSGNNGGDGYALARHLHNHRVSVTIAALGDPKSDADAAINRRICQRMLLTMIDSSSLGASVHADRFSLIVDAIFGTGLDRAVEGEAARIIRWINAAARPVLAVDVPSGLDGDTGRPIAPDSPCVRATLTATFLGLKPGFLDLDAQRLLGEVVVCDIGAPRELLERFGKVERFPRR